MKKRFNNKLYKKAKVIKDNHLQLRVLYKKVGQTPQVKFVSDIENFKRAIVLEKLDIIPYKHVFIICNNQEYKKQMPINVFFSLYHIAGDLIVVDIDKSKREFKSLTQDQLLYYSKDLLVKEPNKIQSSNNIKTTKEINNTHYERDIETDNFMAFLKFNNYKPTSPRLECTQININIANSIDRLMRGVLFCTNGKYEPSCRKCFISKTDLDFTDEMLEELKITTREFEEMEKINIWYVDVENKEDFEQ